MTIFFRSAVSGLARRLGQSFAKRNAMRTNARTQLRIRAGRRGFGARAAELVEEAAELEQEAQDVVEAAFYEAMDTMYGMCGNPGQESIFSSQIVPAFAEEVGNTSLDESWGNVDIGEYMAFMGEIVAEGNAIMSAAYDEANSLTDEASDAAGEAEELDEGDFEEGDEDQLFLN
jgi:hypothetical protein